MSKFALIAAPSIEPTLPAPDIALMLIKCEPIERDKRHDKQKELRRKNLSFARLA